MIGAIKKNGSGGEFPKLMINENVLALFSDAENAVVVSGISENAVGIGKRLAKGTFDIENFSYFHGTIELSNK